MEDVRGQREDVRRKSASMSEGRRKKEDVY